MMILGYHYAMNRMVSYIVSPQDDGKSVYFILRNRMHVSEAIVRHARKTDVGVMLDGLLSRTDAIARSGQTISLSLFDNGRDRSLKPEPGKLSIVFEDEDLLIINKDPGLVVHPSRGHFDGTLCNHVAYYLLHKEGHCEQDAMAPSPHPVNRLDRDTSGLIVFAKHAHAQNVLQAQLHTNSFKRTYLAICDGIPEPNSGTIDAPIARLRDVYGSFGVSELGKRAVTHYRVINQDDAAPTAPNEAEHRETLSLVELQLETGRTHQIRVHMSHIGCPLLGDDAYGNPTSLIERCALHSWQLDLVHPITQEQLHLGAPLPPDMKNVPIGLTR